LCYLTCIITLSTVNSGHIGTLSHRMSFCKKYFFLPQRMSLRNSIEQFLNVGRKIWPKLDVSLSAFLTLNSQCPMKLLLRTSVPHDCLDRDQRFSWCNVSLRLRTLSKRIHEQLSPCFLFFSEFIANDVYLAIHCFVNFWIFRFFPRFEDLSVFLLLSTVPTRCHHK